jgi:uncharacterized protein (UPF0332 family)
MNIEECYKKRMLRTISPDIQKAKRSIEIAEQKLQTAKDACEKELYGPTLIYGYTSMFHASRALLYKDGVQEKSHLCLVLYIKDHYAKELPPYLITSLDSFRKERHESLYGLDFVETKKDAELSIHDAEHLLDCVKKIVQKSDH